MILKIVLKLNNKVKLKHGGEKRKPVSQISDYFRNLSKYPVIQESVIVQCFIEN